MTNIVTKTENQPDFSDVELAQSGDVRGFAQLHDRHWQSIYTFFFYRVSDVQLAEDLASEVFVRMVTAIDRYQNNRETILPWLYTIARNLLIDHYRKRGDQQETSEVPVDLPAVSISPEQNLMHVMEADCLQKALTGLTEEQREVILGKFIEGRSNRDIAKVLRRTEGSVKSLQHRALGALRRMIEKEGCYEPQI